MSSFVSVAGIEDELTECPVCLDQFDEAVRIPRQMSCCMKSICQTCLQQLLKGLNPTHSISCPMCRQKNNITNGMETFPKEQVILKILDHIKLQKRVRLSCTDCPESSPAGHQCDNCQVFLCKRCRRAHERNIITKHHSILSLEDMRGRPLNSFSQQQKCSEHPEFSLDFYCSTCSKPICVSCPIVNHKAWSGHVIISIDEAHRNNAKCIEEVLSKVDEKRGKLVSSRLKLSNSLKLFQTSLDACKRDINKKFDEIIKKLQKRRTALIGKVDEQAKPDLERIKTALDSTSCLLGKVTSTTEHIRNLRSKASKLEDLQLMTSSTEAMKTILEENTEDLEYGKGVEFAPGNMNELLRSMEVAGSVKTVPSKSVTEKKQTSVGNFVIDLPAMTFSSEKVHKLLKVVDEQRQMTNMMESGDLNRPGRFSRFRGTCCSPIPLSTSYSPFTIPSYWETSSRLNWEAISQRNFGNTGIYGIQLEMGLVERRANLNMGKWVSDHLGSVCVSVQQCYIHDGLCIQVNRTDQDDNSRQVGECVTLPRPIPGTELNFTFGLVLDVGRGRVAFIDVLRRKLLCKLDMEFKEEIFPMFHVYPLKFFCAARMRLVSGGEIFFTDWKKHIIQQALSN